MRIVDLDHDIAASVTVVWLPVGATGHVVRYAARTWECARALRAHRRPVPLFHPVLEVAVDGARHVIEMAPIRGRLPRERGVIAHGPVGLAWLGRFRLFRYEVRCWRDGVVDVRGGATGTRILLTDDATVARALLARVACVPLLTWGRTVSPAHEMWNSNSLVSWLLAGVEVDPERAAPPHRGGAPGWAAGLAVATSEGFTPTTGRASP